MTAPLASSSIVLPNADCEAELETDVDVATAGVIVVVPDVGIATCGMVVVVTGGDVATAGVVVVVVVAQDQHVGLHGTWSSPRGAKHEST